MSNYKPLVVTTFKDGALVQLAESYDPSAPYKELDNFYFYDANNNGQLDVQDLYFDCCSMAKRHVDGADITQHGRLVSRLFSEADAQRRQLQAAALPGTSAGWCEAEIKHGSVSVPGNFSALFSVRTRRSSDLTRRYTAKDFARIRETMEKQLKAGGTYKAPSFDPSRCDTASASVKVQINGGAVDAWLSTGYVGTPAPGLLQLMGQSADEAMPDLKYNFGFGKGMNPEIRHVDIVKK